MALLAQQADLATSTDVLEQALKLPETTDSLRTQIQYQLIKYLGYSRTKSEEEARELAQNCISRAWAKREEYDAGKGEPGAWLHGFANHVVREYLQKLRRLPKQLPEDLKVIKQIASPHDKRSPYEYQREFIDSILPQFSEAEQQLIQLYLFKQLSQIELAETLFVSAGTLRTRLNRVRSKLRTLYQTSQEDAS